MKQHIPANMAAGAYEPPMQATPVCDRLPPLDMLAPLLAGARARGIADAYEMLGLGVVLLSESGRVLHASERACRLLQGAADVVSAHLVGATPEANATIEKLIGASFGAESEASAELLVGICGRRITLRISSVPQAPGDSAQLLKSAIAVAET